MLRRMALVAALAFGLAGCASPPPAPGCPGTGKKPINGRGAAPAASKVSEVANGSQCGRA